MNRIPKPLTLLLLFFCIQSAAQDICLSSPNGRLKAIISSTPSLSLQITLDDQTLMDKSPIGLSLNNGTEIGQFRVPKSVRPTTLSEEIISPFHRQKSFRSQANELRLRLNNGFGITFRAYDEGVAYRFHYQGKKENVIKNEIAKYRFGNKRKAWLAYSTNHGDPFAMGFQNIYHETILDTARRQLAFLPATVDCGKAKVTILESSLHHYPGMFVKADGGNLVAVFPPYPKTMARHDWRSMTYVSERHDFIAKNKGEHQFPWRIFAVSEADTDMPTNNLVYALAEPSRLKNTDWIKPGKVAWDWWNDWNLKEVDFKAGINTETYKYYIDFAAKHQLEYIILDEGWYDSNRGDIMHPIADVNLPELIEYGRQKGVGIVLWAVFNVMDENLETVCRHYANMGIKGFKVDFLDRNDQTANEMVERLADCAARNQLLLDFHGFYTPAGLNRTYPNILNYEGVFGMEEVKWGKLKNDHPRYDVTFPFIRMMAGQVDFTPGAMRNGSRRDWLASYSKPMSQGTRAHQAATYIVYDSPFTMLADTPTSYEAEPNYTAFIAALPTVFDKTVVLQGKIGDFIVTLREKDHLYYIGGMTNWDERDITVDLGFMPKNIQFTATTLTDGINANKNAEDYKLSRQPVTSSSTLNLHLASGGGFVVTLEPATR